MKKITKFLLFLALLAFGQSAWAQQQYITDVKLIGCLNNSDIYTLRTQYENEGWIFINQDLNAGVSNSTRHIYLLYKTNDSNGSSGTAITNFYLKNVASAPSSFSSFTINGLTYSYTSGDGDVYFTDGHCDLNTSTGSNSQNIYLCYSKTQTAYTGIITSLSFNSSSYLAVGSNGGFDPCDLNEGAGGLFIYLHITKVANQNPMVVTNGGQLQEAVTYDNANIRLDNDIELSSYLNISDKTLTIDLNGHKLYRTISGSYASDGHVIYVHNNANLSLLNDSEATGSIEGGKANNGGAMFIEPGSYVIANNVTFQNNSAGEHAGAIWNAGSLTLTNCTISNNTAQDVGGIYNAVAENTYCGTATLTDCTFSGNSSITSAGALANATGATSMTLDNCTITGNTAATNGGAIWNGGTLTITSGSITGNTATNNGGGIYHLNGTLNMSGNPVVIGNTKANSTANNVYLASGKPITVTGAFTTGTNGANLGITLASNNDIFTSGYRLHNTCVDPNTIFHMDNVSGNVLVLCNGDVTQGLSWTSGTTTCTLGNNGTFSVIPTNSISGAMDNYYSMDPNLPWREYLNQITNIVVEDGVTHVGDFCFTGSSTSTITLGKDLTTIGKSAFYNCSNVTNLTIPVRVRNIGAEAFGGCISHVYCYTEPNLLSAENGFADSFLSNHSTVFHVCSIYLSQYQAKFPNANVTWNGTLQPSGSWTDSGNFATSFAQSSDTIYYINNEEEMALLAYMVNVQKEQYFGYTFKLNCDLSMANHYWIPIGIDGAHNRPFLGTFDGQGHTISGIVVNRSDYNENGLFAWVGRYNFWYSGVVENLRLFNSIISGGEATGAIVGYLEDGRINNCVTDAVVHGGNLTGGIVGTVSHGDSENYPSVINCLYIGNDVTGGNEKGPVVGCNTQVINVSKSYYTNSSLNNLSNSLNVYALPVTIVQPEGATITLLGNNHITYEGTEYYATDGSIKFSVIPDDPYSSITHVYINNTDVINSISDDGTFSLALAFNMSPSATITATVQKLIGGSGTEEDPFTIANLTQWNNFASLVTNGATFEGKFIKVTADISGINSMAGLNQTKSFQGTFDGGNHILTGSFSNSNTYAALFPHVQNATIKNLQINGSFTVGQHGAALVGKNYGTTTIENVKVLASITAQGDQRYIGGIVGHGGTSTLTLKDILFKGTVSNSSGYAGGLIGWSDGMTLTLNNCTFKGNHTGDGAFHPIAAKSANKPMNNTITNTYFYTGPENIQNKYIAVAAISVQSSAPRDGVTYVTATDAEGATCYYFNDAPEGLSIDYDMERGAVGYYYLNMERANENMQFTIPQDATTFRVYDCGGKSSAMTSDGSYNKVTSRLKLTAPAGKSVHLSGQVEMDANVENLYINDNRGVEHFRYSYNQNGQPTIPEVTMSDNEAIIISVNSNHYLTTGFEIAVTVTNRSSAVIESTEDWNAMAANIQNGGSYRGTDIYLNANINVSTPMGNSEHPFDGNFEGNGRTITADINGSEGCEALFRYIKGVKITNLKVAGNFVVGQHGAALVGNASCTNYIDTIAVTANVSMHSNVATGNYHHGGVIGHATNSNTIMRGVVFSGTLSSGTANSTAYTGGLIGWSDNATITMKDCLFCGTYNGTMPFHPIAVKNNSANVNTTVSNVLYIYTTAPVNCNNGYVSIQGEPAVSSSTKPALMGEETQDYHYLMAYEKGFCYDYYAYLSNDPDHYKFYYPVHLYLDDNTDNSSALAEYDGQQGDIILQGHTLYTNGNWNTLCLPFSMTAAQLANSPLAGAKLMEFNGATSNLTNGTMTLNFANATTITAGRPFIAKWPKIELTAIGSTTSELVSISNLLDGKTSTTWEAFISGGHWIANFSTIVPVSISSYTMTTGNDNSMNPIVWTLKAKLNENDEWITIDSRNVSENPEDALPITDHTAKSYDIAAGQQNYYRFFRLDITENNSNNHSWILLSEFSIEGELQNITNPRFVGVVINATASAGVNSSDGSITFKGSYAPVNIDATGDETKFLFDNNSLLYSPTGSDAVNAQGAYFQLQKSLVANDIDAIVLNWGNTTVEKFITAATNWSTESNGWYFIASPITEAYTPTGGMIANDYDLYRLNNNTWENIKASSDENHSDFTALVNGRGYLYANSNDQTLVFTGTAKTYNANYSIPVSKGWNLVGNPYTFNTWANTPFYTMNTEGTGLTANTVSTSTAIPPCTSIVVNAVGDGSIIFSNTMPSQSNHNSGNLQITLSQQMVTRSGATNTTMDNAIVSFNESDLLEKFNFGDNAKLYIPQGDMDYAIAYSEKQGEMPLNFKATKNGSYTITVNAEGLEMDYLHLIDNLTGADIDLMTTPSYSFEGKTDDYASRFKLVFSAVDNDNDNENFAFISNGEIIITGTGTLQLIDMLGHQLFSREATSDFRLPTSDFSNGVYVLRLINGENVKTQKIIVK